MGDSESQESYSVVEPETESSNICAPQKVPSWAAFNLLIHAPNEKSDVTCIHALPLISAPAQECQTLLTIWKQSQHISSHIVGSEKKIIITLDMDLYKRAIKLQALNVHLQDQYVLLVGECLTVPCSLRTLGSFIEGSGIDDAWVEAELYGTATLRQIIEGKHMERVLQAHATTLQVCFDMYIEAFLDENPQMRDHLQTESQTIACNVMFVKHCRMPTPQRFRL